MASIALLPAASPGAYNQEFDASPQITGTSTTIGAAVFASRRGPTVPTFVSSIDEYDSIYGLGDIGWGYGHVSCRAFLTESAGLWCRRVVNTNAAHGWLSVENDSSGSNGLGTRIVPYAQGNQYGYQDSNRQVLHLVFSRSLVTGNNFNVVVSVDDVSIINLPVTVGANYSDTSLSVLTQIAASISDGLYKMYSPQTTAPGYAQVLPDPIDPENSTVLRVVGPTGRTISVNRFNIAGGSAQPTVSVHYPRIFDVVAANPGSWGNEVGITITDINMGVPQKLRLLFSGPMYPGQNFIAQLTVQGSTVMVGPVPYTSNHAVTFQNIAAALKSALGQTGDSYVVPSGSGANNDREIHLVSPVDGPETFTVDTVQVGGGSVAVAVIAQEVLSGVEADDTFRLNVYTRDNINFPAESFVVSLKHQLDGYGQQQHIEEVINVSAIRSNFIRIKVYTENLAAGIISSFLPNQITWLNGGANGSLPTNSQIIAGWDDFSDPENADVRILINCGYTATSVQQKIDSIAASRKDCFAVLDMPSALQSTQDALSYRRNVLNINSNYSAIYSPDLQITDTATDRIVYVPPSGYVAARFAHTDLNYGSWWAAAGLTRGVLKNVTGLRKAYRKGDRDLLNPSQVNCLRQMRDGSGIVIWGVETLQTRSSLLSFVPVRRHLIKLQTSILSSLNHVTFDPILDQTKFLLVQRLNSYLQPEKDSGGLVDFLVLCDDRNNKPYHRDAGQLNVSVYFVPTTPARTVLLRSIITPSSISFQELIVNGIQ